MLLRAVNEERREHHKCPIIFIGHSFGGIIIKEAICLAETDKQYRDILDDTIGIIFLGTPHQGSNVSQFGAFIARLTWVFGSSTILLKGLYRDNPPLSDLQERFMSVIRRRKDIKLVTMYEKHHTYFAQLIYLGFIVERNAAVLDVAENIAVEKDHMGLNKCASPNDPAYDAICQGINRIRDHAESRGWKKKYLKWSERSRL
ncbi:hypothetical protein BO83DRAFT_413986 [Aspergillus eucalypticola CBS 122712]|uniref:DUF676 domain-containing protein n=1 Tax=Aspergillus eucalypticola (strain CBS 122712 / IBT 29274) TaxID=1448314 RepID=A0A317WDW7_ASPEC|nr:uncharacterized protein BO83DRAFT_413986 [Aspergillus eucalypticola CBS 122712]PWY82400.1 hypothetical protein BO83DRAFT_413986 [Aspergillus eucalypticola CBS 122712]